MAIISLRIKKNYFTIRQKNNKNSYFIVSALNNLLLNINVFVLFVILIKPYSNEFHSEINLVIYGSNQESNIISDNFYKLPSEVYINGTLVTCNKKCFLGFGSNNITIKFNSSLNSSARMFQNMDNVLEIDLSKFDSSYVTSMSSMFEYCTSLQKINFGNINTSIVQTMDYCFHGCYLLSSIDLSKFNTSSVVNMEKLFSYCNSTKSIDVSNFNTSKVENMFDLFAYCYALISLNLTNFDTSNVQNMQGMFCHDHNIKYLDLSHFNVSKAINMKYLFQDCNNLKYLDISNVTISSITSLNNTFISCRNLIILKLDSFEIVNETQKKLFFGHIPSNIKYCSNESNIINYLLEINRTFNNCSDICFKKNIKIVDEDNKCVESCKDTESIFEYGNICYKKCPYGFPSLINNEYICLNEIPDNFYLDSHDNIYKYKNFIAISIEGKGNQKILSNSFILEPSQVWINGILNISCKKSCELENDVNNITIWFEKIIESFENMFNGVGNTTEIDLSNIDSSKVTDMSYMFYSCTKLQKINFGNINTSSVKNMRSLFQSCNNLNAVDISKFDTSSVTDMEQMFSDCYNLEIIDVSNFNTSKVENMFDLFDDCYLLTSLNSILIQFVHNKK